MKIPLVGLSSLAAPCAGAASIEAHVETRARRANAEGAR